jgi:hypothetical protein
MMVYLAAIGLVLISLPFMILYTFIKSFWAIFGATIIAFFILAGFGATMEECMVYSGSLGFFVGVYLKYREESKSL